MACTPSAQRYMIHSVRKMASLFLFACTPYCSGVRRPWCSQQGRLMLRSAHAVATNYTRIQRCRWVDCTCKCGIQRTCLGPHGASRKVAKLQQRLWGDGRRHGRLLFGPAAWVKDSGCICQQEQYLRAHLSRQQRRRCILGTWRLLVLLHTSTTLHGRPEATLERQCMRHYWKSACQQCC